MSIGKGSVSGEEADALSRMRFQQLFHSTPQDCTYQDIGIENKHLSEGRLYRADEAL